jgi:hypothetical protein
MGLKFPIHLFGNTPKKITDFIVKVYKTHSYGGLEGSKERENWALGAPVSTV